MANTRQGEIQAWDTIRIPLVFNQTSRVVDLVNPGMSSIAGLAVAGTAIAGTLTPGSKDKRLINFIPESINQALTSSAVQGDNIYYIVKRPGFATKNTPSAGNVGYDVHLWLGHGLGEIVSAFGNPSHIYLDTTDLGAVTGTCTSITETIVGTTPTIVITTSDSNMWYYQPGGSLTKITDSDWPGTGGVGLTLAGPPVHIDTYTFIMCTNGAIYNSDSGSISSWTAGSFILTNISPDQGVGLGRYRNNLCAFGQESVEFFNDGGNSPGSPLSRMDTSFIKIGALNANCIVNVEDTTVWAATSDKGGVAIFAMQAFSPQKISTTNIDLQLSQTNASGLSMSTCKIRGKTLIFIQSNNSIPLTTFVYSMEEQVWHEWRSGINSYWFKLTGQASGGLSVYGISNTSTSGKVYILDPTNPVYTDDGSTYISTFQSAPIDASTENWKRMHKLKIIGDRQIVSPSLLTIYWTDDDYQTFKGGENIDLSGVRLIVRNMGSFRRRAIRGDHISPTACRIEAIELDLSQNDH